MGYVVAEVGELDSRFFRNEYYVAQSMLSRAYNTQLLPVRNDFSGAQCGYCDIVCRWRAFEKLQIEPNLVLKFLSGQGVFCGGE